MGWLLYAIVAFLWAIFACHCYAKCNAGAGIRKMILVFILNLVLCPICVGIAILNS